MSIYPWALVSSKPIRCGKPQSITRLLQKNPTHKTICLVKLWTHLFLETAEYFGKVMANFQVIKNTQDLIISISQGNKEKGTPYCGILIFSFSLLLHYFLQLDVIEKSSTVCSGNWSGTCSLGKIKATHDSYFSCDTRREHSVMRTVWGFEQELRGN